MAVQTSTIQPDGKNVYRQTRRPHPKHKVSAPPQATMDQMKVKFPFIGLAGKQKRRPKKGFTL